MNRFALPLALFALLAVVLAISIRHSPDTVSYTHLDVYKRQRENLHYWVGIRRSLGAADITAALERVGAAAWGEQPARTLSAGQKRRVALAGVILFAAPLWLLDEPATNLDGEGQRLVGTLIDEQLQCGGVVIVAVHQDLPVRSAEPRRLELSAA